MSPRSSGIVWEGNQEMRRLLSPISGLRPHPNNPRRGNVEAIKDSLDRFGQQRPVLALPDGTMVAGHHVYLAAVAKDWTHVAVVRSDLTEDEVGAYLLADNRTSDLGQYDEGLLAALLRPYYEADLLLGIGYDEELVARLLRNADAFARPDPDVSPAIAEGDASSQPGEIYDLGRHRLACGNAIDESVHDRLVAGAKIHGILTDPPYGINLETDYRRLPIGTTLAEQSMSRHRRTYRPVLGDDVDFDASWLSDRYASVKEQFWFGADYYRATLPGTDPTDPGSYGTSGTRRPTSSSEAGSS